MTEMSLRTYGCSMSSMIVLVMYTPSPNTLTLVLSNSVDRLKAQVSKPWLQRRQTPNGTDTL